MRGSPVLLVTCDLCPHTIELELTDLADGGWDDRDVNEELDQSGWVIINGQDICEYCYVELPEEDED